jgi:membrane protein YdbS with pleckstrin-like domain
MALARSVSAFSPEVFRAIVHRLSRNMAAALLSAVPVLVLAYSGHPQAFYLTLTGLALFIVALLVTVMVEVPIVKQFETWTVSTLPATGISSATAGG